jgi:hypothetical protein
LDRRGARRKIGVFEAGDEHWHEACLRRIQLPEGLGGLNPDRPNRILEECLKLRQCLAGFRSQAGQNANGRRTDTWLKAPKRLD